MNQDTRKDPRAKVLTMTVRYKSATLDEFIEHHSYDVSRGGMFIKTPSPFPPGTLLKFEVKIADEQRLMQGVGRVVWKRESNDSNDTRPSGMGVKFIKIDDESRRTIERLVEVRGDGANAFDQGSVPRLPVATVPAAAGNPSAAPAKPAEPRSRKSTVIGLGAMKPGGSARAVNISSGPPRVMAAAPEKLHSEPFFPKSDFKAEMPALEDQTMMKQAKELLADALRHAGGTPEDVQAAAKVSSIPPHVPRPEPHRSVPPRPAKRESEPMQAVKRSPFSDRPGDDPDGETTIWRANEAAALLAESMRDSVPPPQGEEVHGRITARPPGESGETGESGRPGFRESEPATEPGNSPGSADALPAAKPVVEAKFEALADALDDVDMTKADPVTAELAAKAEPAQAESKPGVAAKRESVKTPASAPPASERASSRSRASLAMLEAAKETSEGGGGGKGVFALVALAAAAGITFYLMRPAPAPLPEPPPAEPAKVEAVREVAPPTPALIVSTPDPTTALSAAPADSASTAPSAAAAPSASAAPAAPAEVSEKPVAAKPVRKYVPRRVPKQKADPAPAEGTPPASDTPPPTPPAEAAPEPPPPAPPPAPPPPTPPPLGDNPY